jgi:hypothetical protein
MGRLNLFQSMMLGWRDLHPYAAAHVVTIAHPLDGSRLAAAIAEVLESTGLTGLKLDHGRRRYTFTGGPARYALDAVPAGADVDAAVEAAIESRINVRFPDDGPIEPFLFFTVATPEGFRLGVSYDHLYAGGDSIAALLSWIVARYEAPAGAAPAVPRPVLDPPRYGRLFRAQLRALVAGFPQMPALVRAARRSTRPRIAHPEDGYNGYIRVPVAPGRLAALRAAGRAWQLSTNDLLLAALLLAVAPLASDRGGRRPDIAVASIVNVRADFQPPPDRVFGQFLSAFRVTHPVPPGATLRAVAADIAATTRRVKSRKLYLQSLLLMAFARPLLALMSPERRAQFFFKHHPAFGGLTLLNVDALWPGAPPYLRAASTGPLTLLVLAASVAGGELSVGMTFRLAELPREAARALGSRFASILDAVPRPG